MGQYLSVGILTQINIKAEELTADTLKSLKPRLSGWGFDFKIYEGDLSENSWSGKLKPAIINQELLPFLKETYTVLGKFVRLDDEKTVLEKLEEAPSEKQNDFLQEPKYYNLQLDRYADDIHMKFSNQRIRISFSAVSLFMAGKLMMESHGGLFNLFSSLLHDRLKDFSLAKALRVYITG
ncbi:MAG: hypothetical protein AAGG68_24695 [Bacteroidota bacterium]